jgi:hypothetical protein
VLEETRGSRVQLTIGLEPCQNRSLRPHLISISVTTSLPKLINENLKVLVKLALLTEFGFGFF